MKNIKDITLSIFAVIGFVALLSSFTNQPQSEVTNGTPESHVWAFGADAEDSYVFNKVTGEIRKLNGSPVRAGAYRILKPVE